MIFVMPARSSWGFCHPRHYAAPPIAIVSEKHCRKVKVSDNVFLGVFRHAGWLHARIIHR